MTEATNGPDSPADETTPRDSAPVIADFEGDEDPDGELVLRALLVAGAVGEGERR